MKKWLILLALIASSGAFADTFAFVSGQYKNGNPPGTCAISASVAAGQVIIGLQEGGGTSTSVSDGTNTYSVLYSVTSVAQRIFWTKVSTTGTYTLTLSGSSGTTYFQCFAVTGFTGTPTSDTSIQNRATGTGTTLAINATSNFNNEVLIINEFNSSTEAVTVTGWNNVGSGASTIGFYAFESTSGTTNNFSGTISTSASWYLALAGIYDSGGGASCTHSGYEPATGALAVPNGTSGTFYLCSGAQGTPNCSSASYYQPVTGACGVN